MTKQLRGEPRQMILIRSDHKLRVIMFVILNLNPISFVVITLDFAKIQQTKTSERLRDSNRSQLLQPTNRRAMLLQDLSNVSSSRKTQENQTTTDEISLLVSSCKVYGFQSSQLPLKWNTHRSWSSTTKTNGIPL